MRCKCPTQIFEEKPVNAKYKFLPQCLWLVDLSLWGGRKHWPPFMSSGIYLWSKK